MKKMFMFCTLLCTMFVLSGCSKDSSKEAVALLKESSNKMKELKSASTKLDMNMMMSSGDNEIGIILKLEGDIDFKNDSSHFNMTTNSFGMNFDTEMYTETVDGITYTYQKDSDGDTWQKSIGSNTSTISLDEINQLIEKSVKVTEVKSTEKGLTKLKVSIDPKTLTELSTVMGTDEENLDKIKDNIEFFIYIDKDKYMKKIVFDFGKVFSKLETDDFKIKEYKMEMSYSNFNKVDSVKVPDEIKSTAKEVSEDDFNLNYTEEDIMSDIIISSEVACLKNSIDFSKYNGELDDYLNSDSYDITSVTKGIISVNDDCNATIDESFTINDKTCTYSDYEAICE